LEYQLREYHRMTSASFHLKSTGIAGVATAVPPTSAELNASTQRRICHVDQTASDLGFVAAESLLDSKGVSRDEIGVLLFVSRTPDYRSPTTAAILQGRLNIPIDCICYDINSGGTGFNIGVQVAGSILENINRSYALVIVGDTPSKLNNDDQPESKWYGDACSAILLKKQESTPGIRIFNKSFGNYFDRHSIPQGGFRYYTPGVKFEATDRENFKVKYDELFVKQFLAKELPVFLDEFASEASTLDAIKSIKLYSAILSNYSEVLADGFDSAKTVAQQSLLAYGYTFGSSIPLQLGFAKSKKLVTQPERVMGLAFGEGLSFSLISFEINENDILPVIYSDNIFSDFRISHEM
jgi:3-oxoacyl-[acyl-carrier-protein] synthase III